jgi:hypothetical protein
MRRRRRRRRRRVHRRTCWVRSRLLLRLLHLASARPAVASRAARGCCCWPGCSVQGKRQHPHLHRQPLPCWRLLLPLLLLLLLLPLLLLPLLLLPLLLLPLLLLPLLLSAV